MVRKFQELVAKAEKIRMELRRADKDKPEKLETEFFHVIENIANRARLKDAITLARMLLWDEIALDKDRSNKSTLLSTIALIGNQSVLALLRAYRQKVSKVNYEDDVIYGDELNWLDDREVVLAMSLVLKPIKRREWVWLSSDNCTDCGAIVGTLHRSPPGNCDHEICPFCHHQLLGCSCINEKFNLKPDEYPTRVQWKKWLKLVNQKGRVAHGDEDLINYGISIRPMSLRSSRKDLVKVFDSLLG